MQQAAEEFGSTALLQDIGMRFGMIGEANPTQDLWDVQSFSDGIGEPFYGFLALLLPILEG